MEAAALERALERLLFLVRFLPMMRNERNVLIKVLGGSPDKPKEKRAAPFTEEFTIVGVLREANDDDPKPQPGSNWETRDDDIILPTKEAVAFYVRTTNGAKEGFGSVELTVDQEANVKQVGKTAAALGFSTFFAGRIHRHGADERAHGHVRHGLRGCRGSAGRRAGNHQHNDHERAGANARDWHHEGAGCAGRATSG